MTGRFALCWFWWGLTCGTSLEVVQTEWQRELFHQVNQTAFSMSRKSQPQLLNRLDSTDVRALLAECCSEVAQLPAEALAKELRRALLAAEVISGFSTVVNRSFFSFSLSEAEQVDHYENLWEVWVRNDAELSNYSLGMDWVETSFFGFKPFEKHAHPNSMAEAKERSVYFLLNSLRVDAGSPLYGDVSVVLKPSFAHATAIISPLDSGSWAGFCNRSFVPPNPTYAHNCSAFPGHEGLGTFHSLDHLFSVNEAYWASPEAFLRPLARLLGSDESNTFAGDDLVRYFEIMPAAQVNFPDIKFVIADFPSLFGTARGRRVRSWSQRHGWVLLWSLGLNLGFSLDFGMPHFWDVFNLTGPFGGRLRLIDPESLLSWGRNVSISDLDAFNAAWWQLQTRRTSLPLRPADFDSAWTLLASKLPDLLIAPVRPYCHDLDLCIGVTQMGCLCKTGAPAGAPESTVII
eukprot:Skav205308  [mRNA]  locus=scaffold3444:56571:57953:+ [translate_table: standard]